MAWFALAMGVFSVLTGITHFLMPREQLHMASGIQPGFFESLRISSAAFTIHYWAVIASALITTKTGSFHREWIGCVMACPTAQDGGSIISQPSEICNGTPKICGCRVSV